VAFLKHLIFILFFMPFAIQAMDAITVKTIISSRLNGTISSGEKLLIEFGVIPGEVFGSPLENPLWLTEIDNSGKVTWPTPVQMRELQLLITRFSKVANNTGLTVIPSDTRFARVSTFGYFKGINENTGAGFFSDNGNFIMLMYFDRPCTLSGSVYLNNKKVSHDINIKSAGFHWIEVTIGKNEDRLSAYSAHKKVVLNVGE
jgi:hypothetical protein